MADEKVTSIGGLWKKEKNGHKYYSGQIEIDGVKHNFVCFHNSFKKDGDNKPDYYIPIPRPRDEQQENNSQGQGYQEPEGTANIDPNDDNSELPF